MVKEMDDLPRNILPIQRKYCRKRELWKQENPIGRKKQNR